MHTRSKRVTSGPFAAIGLESEGGENMVEDHPNRELPYAPGVGYLVPLVSLALSLPTLVGALTLSGAALYHALTGQTLGISAPSILQSPLGFAVLVCYLCVRADSRGHPLSDSAHMHKTDLRQRPAPRRDMRRPQIAHIVFVAAAPDCAQRSQLGPGAVRDGCVVPSAGATTNVVTPSHHQPSVVARYPRLVCAMHATRR